MSVCSRSVLRLAQCQKRFLCSAKPPASSDPAKPLFVTKSNFQQNDYKNRFSRAMDASSGVLPSPLQKTMLILTRMFKNKAEIPEYVADGTMQRMRNRMRGIFLLIAVLLFHTVYKLF